MRARTRQEYFLVLRERYRKAESKSQRSLIVDEAVSNTGLHRKSVIRALGAKRNPDGGPTRLGRPRKYKACFEWRKRLYRASEYACSDRLRSMIPILLSQWKGLIADVEVITELMKLSPATIDRYLRQYRGIERRRFNSRTMPESRLFKKMIPLKTLGTTAPRLGYLQADTVSHGGESAACDFIWSLTMTDERAGWTENRGFFGKSSKRFLPAICSAHDLLPFDLVAINVDDGSVKKTYDDPKTPVPAASRGSRCTEEKTQRNLRTLNYFDLQAQREELLARFEQLKKELNSKETSNPSSS